VTQNENRVTAVNPNRNHKNKLEKKEYEIQNNLREVESEVELLNMNELQTLAKHCLRENERSKVVVLGKESRMKSQEAERKPLGTPYGLTLRPNKWS